MLVHTSQSTRWWLLWNSVAPSLRLALYFTAKHSSFTDAVWCWNKARMGRETSRSSKKNEEEMRGWLGWVSETWGAFPPVISYLLSFYPQLVLVPVAARNTLSPKCYPFIQLLSSPRFKRTLLCFWIHGRQSRRRSCLFHRPSNHIRSQSHSCK